MRFFCCCGDEDDVVVRENGVVAVARGQALRITIEAWCVDDKFDFKKIDERIEHAGRWRREGYLSETVISIPKSCAKEIMTKLRTTSNTGITAVGEVKTDFGIFELEQELKTAKAIKADHEAAPQAEMKLRPAM